jgi:hypothetical protein
MGKWLVLLGVVLAGIGGLVWVVGKVPFVGRLPGDLHMEGQNFKFYFPLMTCLLLSAIFSFILWIVSKLR